MEKNCLVIIDVQEQFRYDGFDDLVDRIIAETKSGVYGNVIAVVLHNDKESPFYRLTGWHGCVLSESRKMPDKLVNVVDSVFIKHGNSAATPEVREYLKAEGITHCFLCGMDTYNCVLSSAFALFDNGTRVTLLSELCSSRHHKDLHGAAVSIAACAINA